jgi:hypothetical protein
MKQPDPSTIFSTDIETQHCPPSDRSKGNILDQPLGMERRRFLRWPGFWSAKLENGEGARSCQVLDFSPGGAKVRSSDGPLLGDRVALKFPNAIHLFGKVAWVRGALLGIEFQAEHLPRLRLADPPRLAMRPALAVSGTFCSSTSMRPPPPARDLSVAPGWITKCAA